MPAKSERQRRFFGAELARARAGKKTQTGLSQSKLEDFARKPKSGRLRTGSGVRPNRTAPRPTMRTRTMPRGMTGR